MPSEANFKYINKALVTCGVSLRQDASVVDLFRTVRLIVVINTGDYPEDSNVLNTKPGHRS